MFSVIENSVNLDAVNLDALYLLKLIFYKYFCYLDSNRNAAVSLQLQLYLDANRFPVHKRVNITASSFGMQNQTTYKEGKIPLIFIAGKTPKLAMGGKDSSNELVMKRKREREKKEDIGGRI